MKHFVLSYETALTGNCCAVINETRMKKDEIKKMTKKCVFIKADAATRHTKN